MINNWRIHALGIIILLVLLTLSTPAVQGRTLLHFVTGSETNPNNMEDLALSGITKLVSVASDGTQGDDYSYEPSISADGLYIAFSSFAENLVDWDSNLWHDIFVHDQQAGQTDLVSVASWGGQKNDWGQGTPSISANGRFVVFSSQASNLIIGDTNGVGDVFVRDRLTGETDIVSIASDGSQGDDNSFSASISGEGRYVPFSSSADNLVSGDTNNISDIFVHDRQSGLTKLISIIPDGFPESNGYWNPKISANGDYVAFLSDTTNFSTQIYLYDRKTSEYELISTAPDGTPGNSRSFQLAISSAGRYIAFTSEATNLLSTPTNGLEHVYVRDRLKGQTNIVSLTSDGTQENYLSNTPSISGDGRFVAFKSGSSNLVFGDTNHKNDIFLHDRITGKTVRVSLSSRGEQSNDHSFSPSISFDGSCIAFSSSASNLVEGDTNGYEDIFIHHRYGNIFFLPHITLYQKNSK